MTQHPSTTTVSPLTAATAADSPFLPGNSESYRRWRDHKLGTYSQGPNALLVDIEDPRALRKTEAEDILQRCRRYNMAIYRSSLGETEDKDIPRVLGHQFGLNRLDPNMLADDDGITSLQVVASKQQRGYIPYSSRRLLWHTDGYYNPPERTIHAFILHCVRPAPFGGENSLLDPEIVFIQLMDDDPEIVRLLMQDDVMSIPANDEAPGQQRKVRHGPVFALDQASGRLHMRYTHRAHSIQWKQDGHTRHAVERLKDVITNCNKYVFNYRLQQGEGLICNNVLHSRTAFENDPDMPQQRLLYRARYYDPINEYIEIT